MMRRTILFGLLMALAASHIRAAEMANLRNGFSIRHERREVIGDITRLYTAPGTASYVDVATSQIDGYDAAPPDPDRANDTGPGNQDLNAIISNASARSRIDKDFIASVIHAESANDPRAVSPKGARGLMQLMPQTANGLGVKDSLDPAENVDAGVRYLRELLLRYDGDPAKALAAYNAGPERVDRYRGLPPYRETHQYVARVITEYNRKKLAARQPAGPGR